MSWRTGSTIFLEFWPIIKNNIENKEERILFTKELISLFVKHDMDTLDLEKVEEELDHIVNVYHNE